MAKVNFTISTKVDSRTGKAPILIRFIGGREMIYRAKSGLTVDPKRWKKDEGNVILPRMETLERKELAELQTKLSKLSATIIESFVGTDKSVISKDWLNRLIDEFQHPEKYKPVENIKLSFFATFEHFLATKKISVVRKKNYGVVLRALKRYELLKKNNNKLFTLDLDTFTIDTLRDIEYFMMNEYKYCEEHPDLYKDIPEYRTPKPRGLNTINCNLTKLRTFINWSIDKQLMSNNPFKGFETPQAIYGTPFYITISERNKLYQHDLSAQPDLAIQRDVFVFQCLVGCRISDLYSFTKNSVINGAIEYIARKSKEGNPITVRVPLSKTAKEILNRYSVRPGNKLLPFITEQAYRKAIKIIFAEVGLTRMVTVLNPTTRQEVKRPLNELVSSHLARRTFIGNLYKKVKDPNLVGSLSGHKEGSKAFARYREIDDEMKQELVDLLDE